MFALQKVVLMSTHNIWFLWRNNKNYPQIPNTHLIYSSDSDNYM